MVDESRKVIGKYGLIYYKEGKYANVPLNTGKEYKDCLAAIRVRARLEKK